MVRTAFQRLELQELETRFLRPLPTLLGTWTDIHRGTARRRGIVVPVDDAHLPTRLQRAVSVAQQIAWLLNVENIEQHGVGGTPAGAPTAVGEKVSLFDDNIRKSCGTRLQAGRFEHLLFDVECVYGAARSLCRRYREEAIAAAKLHDIPLMLAAVELRQDAVGIEKTAPVILLGHPALPSLHSLAPTTHQKMLVHLDLRFRLDHMRRPVRGSGTLLSRFRMPAGDSRF